MIISIIQTNNCKNFSKKRQVSKEARELYLFNWFIRLLQESIQGRTNAQNLLKKEKKKKDKFPRKLRNFFHLISWFVHYKKALRNYYIQTNKLIKFSKKRQTYKEAWEIYSFDWLITYFKKVLRDVLTNVQNFQRNDKFSRKLENFSHLIGWFSHFKKLLWDDYIQTNVQNFNANDYRSSNTINNCNIVPMSMISSCLDTEPQNVTHDLCCPCIFF